MLKNDKTIKFCIVFYWLIQSLNATFIIYKTGGFPGGSEVKASACNAGDLGSISGSGRSPGEGNGNPLQYYCLENPMDGGAWWATVHRVTKSQTQLSDFTFTFKQYTINTVKRHLTKKILTINVKLTKAE